MMRDEFGAQNERSLSVAISSHTSGLSLTAQQPVNNIVRGTLQALSLVLGGVQALEISAFDEAYRTPSKEAHLVGLRTQQIIDIETGAGRVPDPLGGSVYVEALTDEMERRIRARVDELEALGDAEALCADGVFREIFHTAMAESQRRIDSGDLPVVGLNVLRIADQDDTLLKDVTTSKIPDWHSQIDVIRDHRASRDIGTVCDALQRVHVSVRNGVNLVPVTIDALDRDATAGEIVTTMRRALSMPPDLFDHSLPAGLTFLA